MAKNQKLLDDRVDIELPTFHLYQILYRFTNKLTNDCYNQHANRWCGKCRACRAHKYAKKLMDVLGEGPVVK